MFAFGMMKYQPGIVCFFRTDFEQDGFFSTALSHIRRVVDVGCQMDILAILCRETFLVDGCNRPCVCSMIENLWRHSRNILNIPNLTMPVHRSNLPFVDFIPFL